MEQECISVKHSQQIFQQFLNGRVINRHIYDENVERIENPLFTEIFTKFETYRHRYLEMGYELVPLKNCYFIRSMRDEKSHVEAAAKVQALIIIIGRAVTLEGYDIEVLFDPMSGFTEVMASEIDKNEEYRLLLEAVKLKDSIWNEARKVLVERCIAEVNAKGNVIFLDAARAMYEALIKEETNQS